MENTPITDFPVIVYGELEAYNEVISKGRCRIFYKGGNRNGTYITDAFAEKLLKTIVYTPIKGIYDTEEEDYTDHGERRDLGRIYGIVPADPHLAWEKHTDSDGVEREYICTDVLLYTGLYAEAAKIPGKAQSMELYAKSIKGSWQELEGKRYYVFEDGCFLGLQALGDTTEPCFEGAAFYDLNQTASKEQLVELLKIYNTVFQINKQGGLSMPTINYMVSDSEKFDALWSQLNTHYNEEGNWSIDCDICAIYDKYAVIHNYADNSYERIYYVKDDNADTVTIAEHQPCYIIDVDEEEKEVIDFLRKQGCHTLNEVTAHFDEYKNLTEKISENSMKVEELNTTISTLTMERDEANNQIAELNSKIETANTEYATAQSTIETLTQERDSLATYKKTIEDDAKKAVIAGYAENLSADILDQYTLDIDKYTAEELDMKLTYEVKKAHPEIFSHNPQPAYIPKEVNTTSGLADILSRYEKH